MEAPTFSEAVERTSVGIQAQAWGFLNRSGITTIYFLSHIKESIVETDLMEHTHV